MCWKVNTNLQLPYFYANPNVARVNVVMDLPPDAFKFEKVKGKWHSEVNLMGVAYKPDGSVGGKFSDTVKFDFDDKKMAEELVKKPVHYETQFEIGTGKYNVKVVFTAGGENFGKIEKPISIGNFDGKQFAVSGLALSRELRPADATVDAVLEDRVPMVAANYQVIPTGSYRFKSTEKPRVYLEMFDPSLTAEKAEAPKLALRVVDAKSGEAKLSSDMMSVQTFVRAGNPVVPILLALPIDKLPEGAYRLEIMGANSAGQQAIQSEEFQVDAKGPDPSWGKN